MPICENCTQTLVCGKCGAVVGPQFDVVGSTVLACKDKAGIWVRVRNHLDLPVHGVIVSVSGQPGKTGKTGFATYDDVIPKEHTVTITLEGELAKTYKAAETSLKGTVAKGEVKLFSFGLLPRAKPVVTVPKAAVAVKGFPQKILLTADAAYAGKGVFTCTKGADKVEFISEGLRFSGAKTFGAITEAEVTIEVEAKGASVFEGVEFSWKIDDWEAPDTGKMTAVKAELIVYKKSGSALSEIEKNGDGRTVHKQNLAKERTRAKVEIEVLPAEYKGHVSLTLTKATVELFDKDKLGVKADLSAKIAVGTGKNPEYFVEGLAVSTGEADTALQLKIDDLSDVVDACNLTVMETTLQICAPRVDANTEPVAIADDKKFTAGRTLVKQRTKFTGQRALVRVTKSPLDAPCRLILRAAAGGGKVTFYEATGQKTYVPLGKVVAVTEDYSNENPVDTATAMPLPRTIAVDEVKDLVKGLVFWTDGAAVSTDREVELAVDAEEVDDLCDAVACTVAKVKLDIEIKRTDKALPLDADVDFKLTAPGSAVAIVSGILPKATGKASLDVEAGYYGIVVTPKDLLEKDMRLMRAEPDHSETSLDVFAATTVKFELLPPYEKVQCIGYFMRTGAYEGVDTVVTVYTDAKDLREKKRIQALNDIDGRCEIMKDAVEKAFTATGVKNADPKILKIFMAPEFYFRGKQGAYPLETMSEILTPPKTPAKAHIVALKKELDDTKYQDWLFVLGSAIGAIELDDDPQRTETPVGNITLVETNVKLYVWVENTSPACGAGVGWEIYLEDSGTSAPLVSAAPDITGASYTRYALELGLDPIFPDETPVALGEHGVDTVTFAQKQAIFEIDCPTVVPLVGWDVEKGPITAEIVDVVPVLGTVYAVEVILDCDEKLANGAAVVTDGITPEAVDIQSLVECTVFVDHPPLSPAANAGAEWRLWAEPGGGPWEVKPDAGFPLDRAAGSGSPDQLALSFSSVPTWNSGDTLALGDLYPADEVVSEKLVTIEVQFPGVVVIAKGQFFEVGTDAKGLVESSVDLTGNKHRISIWMPLEDAHGLTVGNAVKFSTPGSAEIVNVALVRKGGVGTPVRADGGAQKELLVYKESISSVDFEGTDYDRPAFGRKDRRAIRLYGDPARRAKATVGATGDMSTSKNEPGKLTTSGVRITETNLSGLGGGSIFTMDGITFGLEVCLDHLKKKLVRYFNGLPGSTPIPAAAVKDEPKIQVQLIPSCGMSIKPDSRCTVADGIIFNVDAYNYDCEKNGGGAKATKLWEEPLTPATAATYFKTTQKAKKGFIEVYEEIKKPKKELVP
ncbi:MAG: hypothetical protein ACKV2U_21910 [Bryobacteraceae bacterium]